MPRVTQSTYICTLLSASGPGPAQEESMEEVEAISEPGEQGERSKQ